MRKKYAQHIEYNRIYKRRKKAAGICADCKQPARPGMQLCEKHANDKKQAYRARLPLKECPRCHKTAVRGSRGNKLCRPCTVVLRGKLEFAGVDGWELGAFDSGDL